MSRARPAPRDVSPDFRSPPSTYHDRRSSPRHERRETRHADDSRAARLPPPVGRVIRAEAPRDRTPEPEQMPAPVYQPRIDHYRWNKIESVPGWNITASVWGPPKPTLTDPDHKLSILWIYDSKRRGWKVHEIVEGHPSNRYGQYTPDAIRREASRPVPQPRDVPRAQRKSEPGSTTIKKEEPVKREQDGGVDL